MESSMPEGTLAQDVQVLEHSLPTLAEPVVKPAFVVISGLPGTGKSYFGRRLAERIPVVILETGALRRALFPEPTYTSEESARLFKATHRLIEKLLEQGIPVLLDATNLVESHRERLYNIAHRRQVQVFLVRVESPPEVVKKRLDGRQESGADAEVHSAADWQVYQRMRPSAQPIRRNHYAVDTSGDIEPVLDRLERDIRRWMRAKA